MSLAISFFQLVLSASIMDLFLALVPPHSRRSLGGVEVQIHNNITPI